MGATPGLARPVPVVRARQAAEASAAPPVAPGPSVEARPSRGAAPRPGPTVATGPPIPVPVAVARARSSIEGQAIRPPAPDVASQARQVHAVPTEDAARPVDAEGTPEAGTLVAHLPSEAARRSPNPPCDASQARSEVGRVASLARVGAASATPTTQMSQEVDEETKEATSRP